MSPTSSRAAPWSFAVMRRFEVRHVDFFEGAEEACEPFPDEDPDPPEELADDPLDEFEDGAAVDEEPSLPFEFEESFASHAVSATVAANPTAVAVTALRTDMRCMMCSSVAADVTPGAV
ncbi:hypothetical protein ACIQU6_15205 [Streptomyces sp. NPDC090442]|uniref:hypothetical protein n=1 Tax=Streptomyces sp. NPDC090442 TaxID=3365962 RepID=UPI00381A93FC